MQSFVSASTNTVAHGMEAAGIQISLPLHVGVVLRLLNKLSSMGVLSEAQISEQLPFVYDCMSILSFRQ